MATRISREKLQKTKDVATRSLIAILGVVIGILIMAQWRSLPARVTNPIVPYASLKDTKEFLYDDQARMKEQIKSLQKEIGEAQSNKEDITLTKDEIAELNLKRAIAGTTKLNGRGAIVILDDAKSASVSDDSIVHAADLRDIVNLLWGSEAEAISINDQRIVVNTAIDCIVNTILVNDTKLTAPFKIEAIGNQELIYRNLNDRSILSNLHQRKKVGLVFTVNENNDITVPIYDGSFGAKSDGE